MLKIKDIFILSLLAITVIGVLIWEHNYEAETIRLYGENSEPADYLVVPEKSTDYWKGKDFKINWYIEGDKNVKSKVQSKKLAKSSNVNNRNLRNNKSNNIHNKTVSYNISMDVITNYIKEKEGFNPKAYRDGCLVKAKKCPSNKIRYSNGYGTLAKSKHEVIDVQKAEKRLHDHIKKTIYPKLKDVKFKSKHQMYASIDFAYNIGHNAFKNNIVDKNGEVDCAKMTEYNVYNGKVNEGLKRRRFENFIQCQMME